MNSFFLFKAYLCVESSLSLWHCVSSNPATRSCFGGGVRLEPAFRELCMIPGTPVLHVCLLQRAGGAGLEEPWVCGRHNELHFQVVVTEKQPLGACSPCARWELRAWS